MGYSMGPNEHPVPPRWPLKVLRFFIKKEYHEEIEGDMEEEFRYHLQYHSHRRSRWIYAMETLKLLRPAVMKNVGGDHQLNHVGMLRNYIKVAARNVIKNNFYI